MKNQVGFRQEEKHFKWIYLKRNWFMKCGDPKQCEKFNDKRKIQHFKHPTSFL